LKTWVIVLIKDFAFSPNVVSIPVGGSVTFKNLDSAAHTATDTQGAFDSGNLDTGKSFTFTFKKAGIYKYVCTYHASMRATIAVGVSPPPAATPDSSQRAPTMTPKDVRWASVASWDLVRPQARPRCPTTSTIISIRSCRQRTPS